MTAEILFLFFSFGMIFCMLSVLLLNNSVLSVISLIGFFLNGTSLFFFFRSEYLGIVYIIVYIGAIAVLFLFVVMMLDFKISSDLYKIRTQYFFSSLFFCLLIFLYLFNFLYCYFFKGYDLMYYKTAYVYKPWIFFYDSLTDISTIGIVIYSYYFFYFLICGLLLFLAMIGAIVLTLYKHEFVKVQGLSNQILREPNSTVYFYKKS